MAIEECPPGSPATEVVPQLQVEEASSGEPHVKPINFRGVEILAPMVRASTLALRLESLRYGADLAFGEEIVDKKIIGAVRVENPAFNTIDFVSPREKAAVFSTCSEERGKVFFQLGTADGALATQAALLVCKDVRGIDVNMGCPKSFSVKGGMGAALLDKPEVAADILCSLRRSLPESCALTCKVRMLPTTARTRDFLQLCERSGAEAVTLHMRVREERPADPAHWNEIVRVWDAVRVPLIANGDFFNRNQIDQFWRHCRGAIPGSADGAGTGDAGAGPAVGGPSGLMIARGAMWNPSIFCRGERKPPPFEEVVRGYVRAAVRANSTYQNTKWVLTQMLAGGTGVVTPTEFRGVPMKAFNRKVSGTKSMAAICELIGEAFEGGAYPAQAHTTAFYRDHPVCAVPTANAAAPGIAAEADGRKRRSGGAEPDEPAGPAALKRARPAPDGGDAAAGEVA